MGCKVFYSIVVLFALLISFTLPAGGTEGKETAGALISPGGKVTIAQQEKPVEQCAIEEMSEEAAPTVVEAEAISPPSLPRASDTPVIANLPEDPERKSPLGISYENNDSAVKAIEKNLSLFQERIRGRFSLWLERSGRYVEIMKDILKDKGLPEDLVFLPIVESGFNPNACSRAAAVGPWQFITDTAKRYGLVVDWWRDERRDPIKSTEAAADYLKDLYGMFGSWKLALAAYNAGEGRILRALKKTGAEDYWSLMETKQLHSETNEYVPKYIAASMIATSPEEYGFSNLLYHRPLEYDEVSTTAPIDIDVIARCAETTVAEIRELNPELKRWSTPLNVSRYSIRIPQGTKNIFIENITRVPRTEWLSVETYTIKKGESLKKIAQKTGVPVSAILAMNSLQNSKKLPRGAVLNLPPMEKFVIDKADRTMTKKKTVVKKKGKKDRRSTKLAKKSKGRAGKTVKAAKGRGKGPSLKNAKKIKKKSVTRVSQKPEKSRRKG